MMAKSNFGSFCVDRMVLVAMVLAVMTTGFATIGETQTTQPGPAVDLEVVNPSDGTNIFCINPGDTLTARLFIRPGTSTTSCTPSCGAIVPGGAAHLATAVVDMAFDSHKLSLAGVNRNIDTAAIDGLVQDNSADGRIGWALAGDWTPDATVTGTLANPCNMQFLDSADWVLEMNFNALPGASGLASFHLRREADDFALSFADICGSEAMTETNRGIDEIIDGTVLVSSSCADVLFFDGFESRSDARWSSSSAR